MKRAVLLCLLFLVPALTLLAATSPAWAFISTGDGGWFWQNPSPEGSDLTAVSLPDASHGWAVGSYGTIRATSDGGVTWIEQRSGTKSTLSAVCFPDASHGWAVGGGGTIVTTSDGGAHWVAESSGTTASLGGVCFPDVSHGWAVGGGGTILATTDGGTHWTQQTSGTTQCLHGVSFPDARQGWAVGDNGTIVHTSDGGPTWTPQGLGMTADLSSVSFPDASHGWVVGVYVEWDQSNPDDYELVSHKIISATTDGGATWTGQTSSSGLPGGFSDVCFPDASHGWVVGWEHWPEDELDRWAVVLHTSDGGAHWSLQGGYGVSASFPDASHGCVVGDHGSVVSTADGGVTWTRPGSGTSDGFLDVCFPDASHGWAASWNGTIEATADGGAHWSAQYSFAGGDLYDVAFPDASHGWAVGQNTSTGAGVIFATGDGGAHWGAQYSVAGAHFDEVSFPDASHGWALGVMNQYPGNVLLATADGGATWSVQSLGTTVALYDVCFPDASHGWAVGSGTILATADGGAHWSAQQTPLSGTGYSLEAVAFPDASHGWAVGGRYDLDTQRYVGVIFCTTDGGAIWSEQSAGTRGGLDGVCFPDASHGWAVGDFGTILATADGGATWTAQDSGTTDSLYGVSFPDGSHGWAVGEYGTILATTDGGWPDTTPPTTTISGADDLWHNTDVSLTLGASDPGAHASGVAYTEYSLDGGVTWTTGTSLTVAAPVDHSNDGEHAILYRSVDNVGNTEEANSATVKIDTTSPVITVAYLSFCHHHRHSGWATHRSSVVRGHHTIWHGGWRRCSNRLSLTYRIDDNLSPTADVTIELVGGRGKVLQTISLGQCPTGLLQVYRLPAKLPRGLSRLRLSATDLAGNMESELVGRHPSMHH